MRYLLDPGSMCNVLTFDSEVTAKRLLAATTSPWAMLYRRDSGGGVSVWMRKSGGWLQARWEALPRKVLEAQ